MWTPLAKKEIRHLAHQRGTWVYVVLCILYTLFWLDYPRTDAVGVATRFEPVTVAGSIQVSMGVLVMFAGLLAGIRSIVGERESGTMGFVAGMPHTRRDIVVGKLLGRTVLVSTGVIAAMLCALVAGPLMYGSVAPIKLAAVTLVTVLYGFCWVAIGIAISSLSRSIRQAIFGLVVTIFVGVLWEDLIGLVHSKLLLVDSAASLIFLRRLAPRKAYHVVTNWILGVGNSDAVFWATIEHQGSRTTVLGVYLPDEMLESVPLFLNEWVSLVVLLLWLVVPLAIAVVRIERIDLATTRT
jgi:ABC-2 type transport system permease protein